MEIMQSGKLTAHRNQTSVTQLTGVEDREMTMTPPTGERPQE
ncbi:hypothetical protein [Streptomyces viridochromogenes]|nr:hypothetical protein [Streptomyces viridochromogenes]